MKITVFTPTFNRAYIISNLFCTLQKQTFRDFEWLVIDDGSTDSTEDLFQKWMKEDNGFLIRYYKVENGGKCRAINKALDLAQGELFFVVDSDDYLTKDALEKIVSWEETLPKGERYCGVSGNMGTSSDQTPNALFSDGAFTGTLLDRYTIVDGERAIAFYTDIHRNYRYPVFPGETFMTEGVAWNRMAHDGYKIRFYNDIICIYEYQEDGLTKEGNQLFLKNPYGYCLWLREREQFTRNNFINKLRLEYSLTCELQPLYGNQKTADCLAITRIKERLYWAGHCLLSRT